MMGNELRHSGLSKIPTEKTGFPLEDLPSCGERERQRPLSQAWITDDLLARTQAVWSEVAGKPVDEDEAVEILLNVKRLAETMWKAAEQKGDGMNNL